MKKIYVILVCVAAMFFAVDANAQFGVGVGYNLGTTILMMIRKALTASILKLPMTGISSTRAGVSLLFSQVSGSLIWEILSRRKLWV